MVLNCVGSVQADGKDYYRLLAGYVVARSDNNQRILKYTSSGKPVQVQVGVASHSWRGRDSCGLTSSRSSSSLCVQVLKLSMAETEESSFFGLFVTEVRPASTSHTLFLYHLPPGTYNCMNIV
jgi:hypothetical protein